MSLDEEILKLVETHELTDQAVLLSQIKEAGYGITQPTLSRHLKKLGVQKVSGRYQRVESPSMERPGYTLTKVPPNLLVVTTHPGYAQPLAVLLDQNRMEHVAGTLAGDDTVLIVVTSVPHLAVVAQEVERLLSRHISE